MTDESRRRNLLDEMDRAAEALRAAQTLLDAGLHADSISRAYYASFHAVRALLLSRGMEPKTHAGMLHLFNTEFVREGALPSASIRLLAGLQRSRELADYLAGMKFSGADARAELEQARTIVDQAISLLRSQGWLPPA